MMGDFVNGFILRDPSGAVTLLDVGLPWSATRVLNALAAIGSGPSDVARIMVTHAHNDHAGAAGAEVLCRGRARGQEDQQQSERGEQQPAPRRRNRVT